jgi:DNA-binding NarL/FixJ family response regulator
LACFALVPEGLVIVDLDLPDMTGFEVLAQVTALYPKLKVLVFSSFPAEVFSSRALNAGAAGYLSKQSSPASVVPALRAMTSSWGSWCDVA